jgi:hypothetical protein
MPLAQIRAGEDADSAAQRLVRQRGDRPKQRERHVLADHRSDLHEPLVLGSEPVDAPPVVRPGLDVSEMAACLINKTASIASVGAVPFAALSRAAACLAWARKRNSPRRRG